MTAVDVVDPGVRHEERRVGQRQTVVGPEASRQTAPGPVLCALDEPGLQCIALDVAADLNELIAAFNRHGLESTLIHGAFSDRLAMSPEAHGMGSGYPLHESGEPPGVDRTHDEVPMVGQEAVGYEAKRVLLKARGEDVEKRLIVAPLLKQGRPAGTAVDDVKVARGQRGSWSSGHGVGPERATAMPPGTNGLRSVPNGR